MGIVLKSLLVDISDVHDRFDREQVQAVNRLYVVLAQVKASYWQG